MVEKPSGQTARKSKPATDMRLRHRTGNDVSSCYATNGLPRNGFHLMAFLLIN